MCWACPAALRVTRTTLPIGVPLLADLNRSSRSRCRGAVRELPVWAYEMARIAVGVPLEVVLVLRLRLPEGPGGRDLGDDLPRPQRGGLDVCDGVLGGPLLGIAGVEDGRPVAGADVVALAVLGRRIVDLKEELQKIPVADDIGVEDDLDGLGVAAVVAVGRIGDVPTGVADPGRDHSGPPADEVLHSPEAASGENRLLVNV